MGMLVEQLMYDGAAGCQNCHAGRSAGFEISRLIESSGELYETQVVALFYLCEECLTLLVARDWSQLGQRRDSGPERPS